MQVAIVTGASRGLGLELVRALSGQGWRVVADARGADELQAAVGGLDGVMALAGDVTDDRHRRALIAAAGPRLDLLVNNASSLGASPLPELAAYPLDELERVLRVNVLAPLALAQLALPLLGAGGTIVNISSDAGVEAYEGWGGYGASKAALDQLSRVLGAERPDLHVYAVDPGDMNTAMHQEAFPGEDISDRPLPAERVPGLLRLLETLPPSGRYSVGELLAELRAVIVPFELPAELGADRPPEARGLRRDHVRLLVDEGGRPLRHARFDELPGFLRAGDLVVVNNSATLPAALPGIARCGPVRVHLSTRLSEDRWVVELRRPAGSGHEPLRSARAGEAVRLAGGGRLQLLAGGPRLWDAQVTVPGGDVLAYLAAHGEPIRYGYVGRAWPLASYQTVFAVEPGSAEMPSAGRAFTAERFVTALVARGVGVVPLTLHTGVSSPEEHEPPYAERFSVPETTARLVNETRAARGRVIAVGTTVVRALESAVGEDGHVHGREGWTGLVVTAERGVRAVDGLLTGLHEPRASHLQMLEAIADARRLTRAYRAALSQRYLWHEFGDLHLILPTPRGSAAWPARRAA